MKRVIIDYFIDGYYIWGQLDNDELQTGVVTCCPNSCDIEDCSFDCLKCPYTDNHMEKKVLDDYEDKLYKIAKYAKEVLNL